MKKSMDKFKFMYVHIMYEQYIYTACKTVCKLHSQHKNVFIHPRK